MIPKYFEFGEFGLYRVVDDTPTLFDFGKKEGLKESLKMSVKVLQINTGEVFPFVLEIMPNLDYITPITEAEFKLRMLNK